MTTTTYDKDLWRDRVLSHADCRGVIDADLDTIAQRASETCVWHAVHEFRMARYVDVACPHCGGPTNAGRIHELCRVRAQRGAPTPRIDSRPKCPCAACAR